MSIKNYITEEMLKKAGKKMGKALYEEVLRPAAEKYVKESDNPYDDMALQFIDDFVADFLKE